MCTKGGFTEEVVPIPIDCEIDLSEHTSDGDSDTATDDDIPLTELYSKRKHDKTSKSSSSQCEPAGDKISQSPGKELKHTHNKIHNETPASRQGVLLSLSLSLSQP